MNSAHSFIDPQAVMRRAIELARRGEGLVEPNPQVGAVIVDDQGRPIAEGYHEFFGGPHAEVNALAAAGPRARGATMFVTLEPCCHRGKTGPCSEAVIQAGIRKVVIGVADPSPHVAGGGIAALQAAGVDVEVGVLPDEAANLVAPFFKLTRTGRPYVHAKWAMSVDGKIATRTGMSRWISNETSRARVHQLRGRMDAILIGSGTARIDDPLLTARPPGPRNAVRIVVDSRASLAVDSQLVRTLNLSPVIVATCAPNDDPHAARLASAGVEILSLPEAADGRVDLAALFDELGRRQMTNVLVEGGSKVLGSMFDAGLIDEVHVFVGNKLIGGDAASPLAGKGLAGVPALSQLDRVEIENLDGDVYLRGRVNNNR